MKYVVDYDRLLVVAIGDPVKDRLEAEVFMVDHDFWKDFDDPRDFKLEFHAPNMPLPANKDDKGPQA